MKVVYRCEEPGCRWEFDNPNTCVAHEGQPRFGPNVKVGDIVTLEKCFGWYNGDAKWIRNYEDHKGRLEKDAHLDFKLPRQKCPKGHGNCFDSCCNLEFYWVVTAVTKAQHRWRIHVASKAVRRYRPAASHIHGYTYPQGHLTCRVVAKPPRAVVAAGKRLIGMEFDNLL
jgi:hypothetical protein